TGYSLSAGGPVIAPGVECVVITPVCAHSLQHCPCIVPSHAEIMFRLRPERNQRAELQIDGKNKGTLYAGDTVRVTGASETLKLARIGSYHFFQVLQRKLNEWTRPREES
ncbi:MAG: NAD(+)/NADH kinase, partial [Oscillospiraceae bacterium]|nr:NAD(+)/NADH kinase [Oscillospiraceae bacterium]